MELDALNGNFDARRVDIVMDVGASLNPAIDIGQIEGGFMQGMGWSCLEELVWGDEGHPWVRRGHLQTKGPGKSHSTPSLSFSAGNLEIRNRPLPPPPPPPLSRSL